jgi:ornithine--oxo-acid transaminase
VAPFGTDIVLTRGEGTFVWDAAGQRYFDFTSATLAAPQGHAHPRIARALGARAARLATRSEALSDDKTGPMLARLGRLTGYDRVLPTPRGAELHAAAAAMRAWGHASKEIAPGAAEVLQVDPRGGLPATCANTAGIVVTPLRGDGHAAPPGFLRALRELCDRERVLLCCDERETGLGRTGKMFAFDHDAMRPDLLVLGSALTGGLYPMGCLCADDGVLESEGVRDLGPLAAAITLAALDVIEDERLPERAARLGARALERLKNELPRVRDVRGRGLVLAVEYHAPVAHDVLRALAHTGILADPSSVPATVVRLLPPLGISDTDLDDALDLAVVALQSFQSTP